MFSIFCDNGLQFNVDAFFKYGTVALGKFRRCYPKQFDKLKPEIFGIAKSRFDGHLIYLKVGIDEHFGGFTQTDKPYKAVNVIVGAVQVMGNGEVFKVNCGEAITFTDKVLTVPGPHAFEPLTVTSPATAAAP